MEKSKTGCCGKECTHRNAVILAIIALISLIVGIILLINRISYDGYEIVKDYTDCNIYNSEKKCRDTVKDYTSKECSCYILLEVSETMKAPVTVYYELDAYDQIVSNFSQSRDDNQLAGHLSLEPATTCGSYSYSNTSTGRMPIAPCGELADAMFTDNYKIHVNNEYLTKLNSGLISEDEKETFKNPPGNLSEAFKNFTKPIHWKKNVWELDTENPENNGFQNEEFIIWMNTDLKRKPAWQVNHTGKYEHGIPPENYTLKVTFSYPTSRYDGRRLFIISSKHMYVNSVNMGIGIALLVFAVLCIILAGLKRFRDHPKVYKLVGNIPILR